MIPAKFGPFRTSRFNVIAIFVNFNRRPAAILDFAKFHFWPQNLLPGAETKLGLKFGENWMYSSWIIQLCIKIQHGVGGHFVFGISGFWAQWLVAPVPLMLHTKFYEDRLTGSKVINVFVSHWNAWERGFVPPFGVKKFFPKFLDPKRHLLGPNRFFWRIMRENRFSGLGCTLIHEPQKNKIKMPFRMNMLGIRRGKTHRPIFFENWHT